MVFILKWDPDSIADLAVADSYWTHRSVIPHLDKQIVFSTVFADAVSFVWLQFSWQLG